MIVTDAMALGHLQWRSAPAFVTLTVAFAMMTDAITYDMVIPFLPDLLTKRLGIPRDEVAPWLSLSLEAFGAAMLVTNYIAGYIVDRVSSKSMPFMAGIAALLASTLLIFLSRTPQLFIISRLLQGASCALVWTSGLAFLSSSIQEADVGFYIGYALVGATAGELIGPVMGGLLYENLGHWAVFTAVEILIFIDIALRLLARDKSGEPEASATPDSEVTHESEPLLGTPQTETGDQPESSGRDIKRSSADLLHIRLSYIMQLTTILVATIVRCAMETAIPLVINNFFGWSSAAAGGVMFALLVPMITSPRVGNLATTRGPGVVSMVVCSICCAALVCLGYFNNDSNAVKILFVGVLALVGLCIAVATAANTAGILILVKRLEAAFPSQSIRPWPTEGMMMTGTSTSWALGLLLGPACASLFEFTDASGWAHLCFALAGMNAAAFICSIITWKTW